jgi:hypothetical protein
MVLMNIEHIEGIKQAYLKFKTENPDIFLFWVETYLKIYRANLI